MKFILPEPKNVSKALKCPKWYESMKQEYGALVVNNTWKLVFPAKDVKIIWKMGLQGKVEG